VRSQCFDGLYHELFNESPELAAPVFALLRRGCCSSAGKSLRHFGLWRPSIKRQ
jgi:hypothetical protein